METLRSEEEDGGSKRKAKKIREYWELLRQRMEYVKENGDCWQQTRIKEGKRRYG